MRDAGQRNCADAGHEKRIEGDGDGGILVDKIFSKDAVQRIAEAGAEAEKHRFCGQHFSAGKRAGHKSQPDKRQHQGKQLVFGDVLVKQNRGQNHDENRRRIHEQGRDSRAADDLNRLKVAIVEQQNTKNACADKQRDVTQANAQAARVLHAQIQQQQNRREKRANRHALHGRKACLLQRADKDGNDAPKPSCGQNTAGILHKNHSFC